VPIPHAIPVCSAAGCCPESGGNPRPDPDSLCGSFATDIVVAPEVGSGSCPARPKCPAGDKSKSRCLRHRLEWRHVTPEWEQITALSLFGFAPSGSGYHSGSARHRLTVEGRGFAVFNLTV
jgi:hypothetical protein